MILIDELTGTPAPERGGEALEMRKQHALGRHDHLSGHPRDGLCGSRFTDRIVFKNRHEIVCERLSRPFLGLHASKSAKFSSVSC
ncbi:MAG: hypothetical protein NTZ11_12830 [Gammaproteobacteria bacterium]|nr:hypothetical protein [Gammaproteobacteria bacterium]